MGTEGDSLLRDTKECYYDLMPLKILDVSEPFLFQQDKVFGTLTINVRYWSVL
jgi:hypothetical protein